MSQHSGIGSVGVSPAVGPIGIAHEWIAARDGSVKTFEAMAQALPAADLYALTVDPGVPLDVGGRSIATTFLDRSSATRDRRAVTLPLMPLAWKAIRPRRRYEVVVTSSHACAKAFPAAREALHRCYCYTPMRYAWYSGIDSRTGVLEPIVDMARATFRRLDRRWAETVDEFAAISTEVAERIVVAYGRPARVIHPPVDTDFFTPGDVTAEPYVLAVSRFVPYKRLDLAIAACERAGLPLVVAGSGPSEKKLRRQAARSRAGVRFEIAPSDARLRDLYRGACALIFPAFEDFGIVPVEAQACGTPVVALDRGGSRDTVVDSVTGFRVAQQSVDHFAEALLAVHEAGLASSDCAQRAKRFSRTRFINAFREWALTGVAGS